MRTTKTMALVAAMTMGAGLAQAQGLVNGTRDGYAAGERQAGVLGGIVGGALGGATGTVNGALGIDPRPAVAMPEEAPTPRRRHRRYHAER